jgi:hypothetical protein
LIPRPTVPGAKRTRRGRWGPGLDPPPRRVRQPLTPAEPGAAGPPPRWPARAGRRCPRAAGPRAGIRSGELTVGRAGRGRYQRPAADHSHVRHEQPVFPVRPAQARKTPNLIPDSATTPAKYPRTPQTIPGQDSSHAVPGICRGRFSWIMMIIHETPRKMQAGSKIGSEMMMTTD